MKLDVEAAISVAEVVENWVMNRHGALLPDAMRPIRGLILFCGVPPAPVVYDVVGGDNVKASSCCEWAQDEQVESVGAREILDVSHGLPPLVRFAVHHVDTSQAKAFPQDVNQKGLHLGPRRENQCFLSL